MNKIILSGKLQNIESSHKINGQEYGKATLVVAKEDDGWDRIPLCFKMKNMTYHEGDTIDIEGNLRSFSRVDEYGKSSVQLYVFSHLDSVVDNVWSNYLEIDGRVCKTDKLRKDFEGNTTYHFILANNIIKGNQKLNSYIPVVCYDELAEKFSNLKINDKVVIVGRFNYRPYIKIVKGEEIHKEAFEVIAWDISLKEE